VCCVVLLCWCSEGRGLDTLQKVVLKAIALAKNRPPADGPDRRKWGGALQQAEGGSEEEEDREYLKCVAYGTVLNVWTNPLEGQMMHVVITGGEVCGVVVVLCIMDVLTVCVHIWYMIVPCLPCLQVRSGLWYSAGGWAGAVSAVRVDDTILTSMCDTSFFAYHMQSLHALL
jgi:hypothetical protein